MNLQFIQDLEVIEFNIYLKRFVLQIIFNEYCDEISMDLESQDILLEYNCHQCDNVYIIADAEQLKRVVNNIISNSVKYMCPDRKGIINIDIFDEEVYVHIIMKDNGKRNRNQ